VAQTTPDKIQNSNLTNHNLNYIIKFEQKKQKNSQDDKLNPPAKMPLLNWNHQTAKNITTVEMLIVLLEWLCSKVWESEFCNLWPH